MPARSRQGGGISPAAVITGVTAGARALRKLARLAKKKKVVSRGRAFVQAVAPKRAAKFRKKRPGIAKMLTKLQQRGFGQRGGARMATGQNGSRIKL